MMSQAVSANYDLIREGRRENSDRDKQLLSGVFTDNVLRRNSHINRLRASTFCCYRVTSE